MITIRRATSNDAAGMADLLNPIIEDGTTTALATKVSADDMIARMDRDPARSAWHVAIEDDLLLGFQWINPLEGLPPEAADIATFARVGQTGKGIGSKLFEATKQAASDLGYGWINANIRADNQSGLTYYASRGFYDYDRIVGYQLEDGRIVDKILKRFDLAGISK